MKTKILLYALISIGLLSCKKEQSCNDGIFDSKKEEKTDCGGVCPPCNYKPTVIENYVSVKIKGKLVSFSDIQLIKSPEWKLRFKNDTIDIRLNLGAGDSLGGRPIDTLDTYGVVKNASYAKYVSGLVLFTEIDHTKTHSSESF